MKYFVALFLIIFLFSCRYDHVKDIPSPDACDTLNPKYHSCVKPLLEANCYSCHSNSITQNGNTGLDLENYDSLKSYLHYQYRGDGIYGSRFMAIIGDSLLIIHMPPTGPIPTIDVHTIDRWIGNGAVNN